MDSLPQDPAILVSSVNMLLRDGEFDNLDSLCYYFDEDPLGFRAKLIVYGFEYSEQQNQIRPIGYND